MTRYTVMTILALGSLAACNKSVQDADDIPSQAATGPLEIRLGGDAKPDATNDGEVSSAVDEVWVRLADVQVNHVDKGWISVLDAREDIDLLALRLVDAGELIGTADVYEGAYDKVKLIVADSWIVVDGVESDLTVTTVLPTDEGVTFDQDFFADSGTTTNLWIGWDLDTQLSEGAEGWALGSDANVQVDLHD